MSYTIYRMRFPFIIVGVIVLLFTFILYTSQQVVPTPHPTTIKDLSKTAYAALKTKLISQVEEDNPHAALQTLQREMDQDQAVLRSCHALVHEIGRSAYRKYQDFAEALRYSESTCSFGYLHGVLEAHFSGAAEVLDVMRTACDGYAGNSFLTWECQHGVGHGLMYYTSNDLPQALRLCQSFPTAHGQDTCASGALMENFVADPDAHPSRYVSKTDPFYPCQRQTPRHKEYCYAYAAMHFLLQHPDQYKQAMMSCHTIEKTYQLHCFYGVGNETISEHMQDPAFVQSICELGKDTERAACIAGMVNRYISYYGSLKPAHALCTRLRSSYKGVCTQAIQQAAGELHLQ